VSALAVAGVPITFRFGLRGRRWGEPGPVVLLLHGHEAAPASFDALVAPLVESGHQVIELDDPTAASATPAARTAEYAVAISEAAVEIPSLESVVAHGVGASAAAQALADGLRAERAVLLGSDSERVGSEEILDSLLGREPARLAA
jgi:alpha-beta hydrolase superfamily lysophospholipase